jgi:hypothetical protein
VATKLAVRVAHFFDSVAGYTHTMKPLLAKAPQTPTRHDPRRDLALDDPVYPSALVDEKRGTQRGTFVTKVNRETTDDN